MKMRSVTAMRVAKVGYIVMSLILCALGVCFLVRPDLLAGILAVILGIALLVFGAVKLVGYFSRDLFRLAFQYDLELGVLSVVLGILLLLRPVESLSVLLAALGVAVLADALFKVRIARDARRFGIRPWWVILALALVSGALGVLLLLWPWRSAQVLTALLGVGLLATGALNFAVAVSTVKIVKNQYPDVIESEAYAWKDEVL